MYTDATTIDWDKEYSPSQNTKRFQEFPDPNEKVLEHFEKTLRNQTQQAQANFKVRSNVRYGGDTDNQLLDIYYKCEEKDSPIFVYIHGGYWQFLDKTTAGSFVEPLVERNYRVIVVDYNLCPAVTLDELVKQLWVFYDWIFNYAKETNAKEISFAGHSAGAQLAALLMSNRFKTLKGANLTASFFLISGLYDLREMWNLESANPKNVLSLDAETAKVLSPFCWDLDKEFVRFCNDIGIKIHVLVAENDSKTFIGQSHEYAKKLEEVGLKVCFKIFDKYDHFDIIEEVPVNGSAINRYIMDNLK